jgi:hypothetical protein
MTRTPLAAALTLALCLVGSAALASPADAAESDIHPEIAYALEALPGGTATSSTTAEWPELGIEYDVSPPVARAVGTCATNKICAYRNANMGGATISFSGCNTWSTTAFGAVGSVANARTSGWADARNSSGTNIKRVGYGSWANIVSGTASIACGGDGISFLG